MTEVDVQADNPVLLFIARVIDVIALPIDLFRAGRWGAALVALLLLVLLIVLLIAPGVLLNKRRKTSS